MEFRPSIDEVRAIADKTDATGYRYVPCQLQILSDFTTPINVLQILKNNSEHAYMLESVEDSKKWEDTLSSGMNPLPRLPA